MEKVILIRYGEIFLKGKNRYFFENYLLENIKRTLFDIACTIKKLQGRYMVEKLAEKDYAEAFSRLRKVCGVTSLSPAVLVNADPEKIQETAVSMVNENSGSFRVTVNRADKSFPISSMDFAKEIGGKILSRYHKLKVDLFNADIEVNVDIRDKDTVYVFTETMPAVGGMPVGTAGEGMVLLSGGIDSPVALFRMAKRGMKIHAIHFHSYPYTSELATEKVIKLAKILTQYTLKIELIIVPVTEIQRQIHEKCPENMMITILRRFMMRIAQRFAKERNCLSITTGESLAQVASQTQESIVTTNAVIDMPVFRPLIGMDKNEIIDTAKQIGTFKTSIEPFEDCCTVFLPKSPVIRPQLELVERVESVLDIDTLVQTAIDEAETQMLKFEGYDGEY